MYFDLQAYIAVVFDTAINLGVSVRGFLVCFMLQTTCFKAKNYGTLIR